MKDEGYPRKNERKWDALNDPLNKVNEGKSLNEVKEGGYTKKIQASGMHLKNQWKNKIVNVL